MITASVKSGFIIKFLKVPSSSHSFSLELFLELHLLLCPKSKAIGKFPSMRTPSDPQMLAGEVAPSVLLIANVLWPITAPGLDLSSFWKQMCQRATCEASEGKLVPYELSKPRRWSIKGRHWTEYGSLLSSSTKLNSFSYRILKATLTGRKD